VVVAGDDVRDPLAEGEAAVGVLRPIGTADGLPEQGAAAIVAARRRIALVRTTERVAMHAGTLGLAGISVDVASGIANRIPDVGADAITGLGHDAPAAPAVALAPVQDPHARRPRETRVG